MRAQPTPKRGRGRPSGSIVRLFDDPRRFEVAAWFAFTAGLGFSDYPAGDLVTFLLASKGPITTESIDGILLRSSADHSTTVKGHTDRVVRKAREAIARADEREHAWLIQSSGLIVAVVKFTAEGNVSGLTLTLDRLWQAGWAETLDKVGARIDASLRSNFPLASDVRVSRTAARLLRNLKNSGW